MTTSLSSLKAILIPTLNRPARHSIMPRLPFGPAIPRIIHQTFYDRALPPELQANVDSLRARNPDWEYRFYDDADMLSFVRHEYGAAVLDKFERINPGYGAARADLFRYLLMYKVGGLYLDIKSSATRPLSSVIRADDRLLLSNWDALDGSRTGWGDHYELRGIAAGEFQQWFIACAPGHPCMKAVLDTVIANLDLYDPRLHGIGKRGVLRTTGPIPFTLGMHRTLAQHPHRVVDSARDLGLEYNLYRNQSHETSFRSHYTTQTAPLVRMRFARKCMSPIYGLVQYLHDKRIGYARRRAAGVR